jgi:hypothetical protein
MTSGQQGCVVGDQDGLFRERSRRDQQVDVSLHPATHP